ncbi:prephenate dehydrogenase/arogenate dehydrogenase family protein [Nocardia sp. NPDC049526]|uniref:prephenate dehydrogenase/arogenate dehydrogenase family protein n=1 Tax=Nocardia sp. NPDC049526 TaxID=3364316 RepID=UPI0037955C3D
MKTPPGRSVREVAIIGTGMIGTSIALALRRQGILTYLCDRDPYTVAMAAARRAGVVGLPAAPVDIAVLAVPSSAIAAVLAECQGKALAHFYTDVGSVKVAPMADAEMIGCDVTNYVGGHPLAGRRRSGPLAASADVFRDRPWALTPVADTSAAAIEAVVELVGLTGAHPVMMTPSEHDRVVARISHVPHRPATRGRRAGLCGRHGSRADRRPGYAARTSVVPRRSGWRWTTYPALSRPRINST